MILIARQRCGPQRRQQVVAAADARIAGQCAQILGGAGYTTLHPIERYWRDARLTKIFEGTSEIQQRIISDNLLGKPTRRDS